MNNEKVWYDGNIVNAEDATVPVLSFGLQYGWGVFDASRVDSDGCVSGTAEGTVVSGAWGDVAHPARKSRAKQNKHRFFMDYSPPEVAANWLHDWVVPAAGFFFPARFLTSREK